MLEQKPRKINSKPKLNLCKYRLDNSISNCELEERKGGATGSGEPLPVAASVSSTVIRCQRPVLESVIPVLAFVTISATGEDECTDYERNHD